MKKFSGLLFCTDLDGTLYSDNKTVSPQNLDAIEYFKAEGGLFTFITGRVPMTAGAICQTIRPNAPYGCLNGGGIYDAQQQRYLWKVGLPDSALELIQDVDRALPDIGIQFNTEKVLYFPKDNDAMQGFRARTGVPHLTCGIDELPAPLLKVVFANYNGERILALADFLQHHPRAQEFDFIRSEHHLYELLPKGVNKGNVLLKTADLLSIDPAKTISVGDYDNDIAMLRTAGLSFAVANASPAAKAAAQHVTVSNNDHAIAAIIDALDRGQYSI